ncbi:MAG: S-methyl-5'-thioadenosine phosphorylase [Candidatus Promineifilaceae bacterium]|nr:S-methyl-5'-thioadenosine phosphorylase [Candidatus Promineifilaceae bacterium]
MADIELGIIGGSGLYDIQGMSDLESTAVTTPFGRPSDDLFIGTLHGKRVVFLPRHGRGHVLTPSEVPYRANIFALKKLGVKYVIAVSACGSLREEIAPGDIVIPDQLVDFTRKRENSFFDGGLVAHVSPAQPFSYELSRFVAESIRESGGKVHEGGSYITIEGPRFSTRGESILFRQWGMGIIGMTTSPEAFLAAEAEIAYSVMGHVTDYDVWHDDEDPVTVELVIRILQKNTELAKRALSFMVKHMDQWAVNMPAHSGMRDALITNRNYIPEQKINDLWPIVGKYLG